MGIKKLRGTQDILPEGVGIWREIEDISREKFDIYGYKEIRTPIIEESALFSRSIGEDTDIVKKQMYSFKEQGGRNICLRPEETVSVVRAYLQHHLDKSEGFVKLFYIGPMFRSERPQAGRLRQFHQIGVEAIGSYSPYLDAEVIILLDDLLKSYGLSDYRFCINTLGCDKDKKAIKLKLRKELRHNLNRLCEDCQRRYKTNILRILDCKNDSCRRVIHEFATFLYSSRAGGSPDLYCKNCRDEFQKLRNILDSSGIKYDVIPWLVRGLDYYTKIVFEVTTKHLGAQDAIAAGGRYDNLISEFGGPQAGACGFAIGIERVIEVLSKTLPQKSSDEKREIVFIATLGERAYAEGFRILSQLRKADLAAEIDYQQRSLKAQMRYADKLDAKQVVILGEDELKENAAVVRDMRDSSQKTVSLDRLVTELSS